MVPHYLSALFVDLQTELSPRDKSQGLDPYDIAARYCHRFVNIHPFVDGNGRMGRLLANIILLRYVGIVAPFGGNGVMKYMYLEVLRRGKEMFHEEDMRVPNTEIKGHLELKAFLCERLEEIGW